MTEKMIQLLASIRAAYPDDPSSPGLVISQIKEHRYYVAVVRCPQPFGLERKIVISRRGPNVERLIGEIMEIWLPKYEIQSSANHADSNPKQA